MWSAISRLLSEQLGNAEITQRHELPGGDVHPAWHIRYGEHDVFVKCNHRDMLSLFTWEADQLALLERTQTVRVPRVYGVDSYRDDSFLLLEYIAPQPLDDRSAFQLGQQLAQLHQWSEQMQFGLDFDNNITTTPQPNSWLRRWSVFLQSSVLAGNCKLLLKKEFCTVTPISSSPVYSAFWRPTIRSPLCCMATSGPPTLPVVRKARGYLTRHATGAIANAI